MTSMDDTRNEDWIKTLSWDLGFSDLDGLLNYLGATRYTKVAQRDAVQRFTELPAWEAAPKQLRSEVGTWLQS